MVVARKVLHDALGNLVRGLPQGARTVHLCAAESLKLQSFSRRDLEVVVPLEAPAPAGFRLAVDGSLLAEVVARMPERIGLEVAGEQLTLLGGSYRAQLKASRIDPPSPRFGEGQVTLPAQPLRRALERVRYAVSREEYRKVLTGVLLEIGSTLRAVASDGFRLALQDLPLPEPLPEVRGILPAGAVGDLLRLLAGEEAVQLSLEEQLCYCQGERFRYATPLLSGEFPAYQRVIPTHCSTQVEVGPELSAALERLEAICDSRTYPVQLFLQEQALHLRSENDYGLAEETVPAVVRGEPLHLTLNARYLREALPAGPSTLRFSGPTTPLLIAGQEGYQALLMPLRT